MTKSPITWYGGKYYMRNIIIPMLPHHNVFVDVFGGSGTILLSKPQSKIDVYNDIDLNLVTFFRILRDDVKREQLKTSLQLSPYSRDEFYFCRDNVECEDDVEKVRRWYVRLMQSFSGKQASWSFNTSLSRRNMSATISKYLNHIDRDLTGIVERLRQVQIENLDFEVLINLYDSADTFFYLDPPYLEDARVVRNVYANEMSNSDHERLLACLLSIKGKALLSGYATKLYDDALNSWNRDEVIIAKRCANSLKSRGSAVEVLWYNYDKKVTK